MIRVEFKFNSEVITISNNELEYVNIAKAYRGSDGVCLQLSEHLENHRDNIQDLCNNITSSLRLLHSICVNK